MFHTRNALFFPNLQILENAALQIRVNRPIAPDRTEIGRLVAQVHTLRRMSVSVNGMLQAGKEPVLEGSIVKDVGTIWEQTLPDKARSIAVSSFV